MPAGRTTILAAALLLGSTTLRAGPAVEPDPNELYEQANARLAHGDLDGATAALAKLDGLISSRPDWDPSGMYSKELLPPVRARLSRLERACGRLDEFAGKAIQDLQPPDIRKDIATVHDYTEWTTVVVRRLREERNRIVEAALSRKEERALLTRTACYARTERLLEIDVPRKLAETAGDDALGLLDGNADLESVLVRFRQLKRDLMQAVGDKEALEKEMAKARQHGDKLLELLGDVVTDDAVRGTGAGGERAASVAERFPRFLDLEREELRGRSRVTPAEREMLRADLDRYRRYNRVLREAGIGQDQTGRIESLAAVVDGLPDDTSGGRPRLVSRWWGVALLIGALSLTTGVLGWREVARRRRRARFDHPGDRTQPLFPVAPRDEDVGRKAV
jgi:hypothetical protein